MSVRVRSKKELNTMRREANTLHVLLLAEILRHSRGLLVGLVREYQFCKRKWRIDLSWPDKKIAVECDGGRYCAGGGKHNTNADYDKINELNHLGWKVLRFNSDQIRKNPMHCIKILRGPIMNFNKTFYESLCEIKNLYQKGFKKYPKDDWFERGVDHHFKHVSEHLEKAKRTHFGIKKTDSLHKKARMNTIIIGNIVHAALRLFMIIQIKILS